MSEVNDDVSANRHWLSGVSPARARGTIYFASPRYDGGLYVRHLLCSGWRESPVLKLSALGSPTGACLRKIKFGRRFVSAAEFNQAPQSIDIPVQNRRYAEASLIFQLSLKGSIVETNVRQWEIHLLPLEHIKPCPKQPRTQFPEAPRAELAANLRNNGQQEPIIVYAKDGSYWIISGGRRYQAAQDAGLTHLRAVILPMEPEPKELLRYQLLCNAHRLDLNPMELCDSYQRLMESDGLKANELASVVSKSKTYISNVLSLASLSPHVQQLVRDGKIGLAKGALLARLGEDALQKALEEIENGNISRASLEQKASKKRGTDKPVRRVALELPTATINLIGKSKVSVEQLIDLLQELIKHCRKARSQGLDLSTLASILRDKATQPEKGPA